MSSGINRPFKYGANDRREFIVQDSEVALVAINNLSGSPIFLGRSKVGTDLDEEKWQIRKVTYDSSEGVIRVEWPQNNSLATADFVFPWTTVTVLDITDISNANPGVVTVSAIGDLADGDKIIIQGVTGMTEVNFDGDNIYTVANIAGNTFELSGIDTILYTAYTDSGEVTYGEVINYTYS